MTENDPELIEKIRRELAAGAPRVDTDAAWSKLSNRLKQPASPDIRPAPNIAPRTWGRTLWRIAAVLVFLAGGRVAWQHWNASRLISLDAPLGVKTEGTLPDGTKIILAPGSHLSWRNDYGQQVRNVTLTGEGYFEVVHNDSIPFAVHARNSISQDIGTRFAVRAWDELSEIEVAVDEGIVAVGDTGATSAHRSSQVHAGQRARIAGNGDVVVSAGVGSSLAWITGEVAFDDTPLAEALPELGRWYDVELRAAPALNGRRLTAHFANQPLPELLQSLSLALGVRVERSGRTITLIPVSR